MTDPATTLGLPGDPHRVETDLLQQDSEDKDTSLGGEDRYVLSTSFPSDMSGYSTPIRIASSSPSPNSPLSFMSSFGRNWLRRRTTAQRKRSTEDADDASTTTPAPVGEPESIPRPPSPM